MKYSGVILFSCFIFKFDSEIAKVHSHNRYQTPRFILVIRHVGILIFYGRINRNRGISEYITVAVDKKLESKGSGWKKSLCPVEIF